MERRKQGRGEHQRFIGFWARLNCENMPVIPAWVVRSNLNDPRRIPYLLVWKDDRHDGKIMEVVRLARYEIPNNEEATDSLAEMRRASVWFRGDSAFPRRVGPLASSSAYVTLAVKSLEVHPESFVLWTESTRL